MFRLRVFTQPGPKAVLRQPPRNSVNKFAAMLFVSASASAQVTPLPETASTNVEYQSVSEALAALHAKPGVEFSEQGGWTIVNEPVPHVLWSFAPAGHAAYPTAVKRAVVESDGKVFIRMGVICESTKSACDALVREFIQLNENMRLNFQSQDKKTK
jgi:hypothetical protein